MSAFEALDWTMVEVVSCVVTIHALPRFVTDENNQKANSGKRKLSLLFFPEFWNVFIKEFGIYARSANEFCDDLEQTQSYHWWTGFKRVDEIA